MKARPFVSVIIPTFKDWQRLALCLQALEGQTYPRNRYEIVVVDNDDEEKSSPKSLEEQTGNVVLVSEPTPGSYAARNAGIRAAHGSIYAFTDSDCVPEPEWLENGVAFLLERSEIGYIGGCIELAFKGDKLSLAEVCEKAFAFRQEDINKGRKYAVTANLMAWREVFDAVGPFDGKLVSGGDWEWGNRAASKGYKIGYCEAARVVHPARHTLGELFGKQLRVSGGQYYAAAVTWYRLTVIVVGFLPPIVPMWKLRNRTDLTLLEKASASVVLYAMRITRSIGFILIGLQLMKPRRT